MGVVAGPIPAMQDPRVRRLDELRRLQRAASRSISVFAALACDLGNGSELRRFQTSGIKVVCQYRNRTIGL